VAVLAPGVVVDRYKILERIGAGAMGEVFLAVDEALGRKVALKILSEAHRNNPELRARFTREGRAVAAISHPNVVQVFTTGEWDGKPYIAMEFLTGSDLGHLVRERGGGLDSLTIANAMRDAAAGLAAAARAGLIHRDVKPSNLMLLADGTVKVTDFGLAKPVKTGDDPALTAMGVVVGTPDYIAPEQARGEPIDSRVDVYALGCTLFFLFAGRPPYRKSLEDPEKYLKVVARHLREPPPDPRKEVKEPPPDDELVELQLQMMAKSADERPSYEEIIRRVERVRARLTGVAAPPAEGSPAPTSEKEEQRARARRARLPTDPPVEGEGGSGSRSSSFEVARKSSVVVARTRRAWWLVAITIACVLLFLVGLSLKLFGPVSSQAAPPAAATDAGGLGVNLVGPEPEPPAKDPTPPPGMLLVRDAAGAPAFFVDRRPVTNAAWRGYMKTHRFARGADDEPVTKVSFDLAKQYAGLQGKRLLRAAEWSPALATRDFVPAGMRLWEWVDDGDPAHADRPVRRVNDGAARRKAAGAADVTFRLAQDLP
jgi:serine/threonine-protein kinase